MDTSPILSPLTRWIMRGGGDDVVGDGAAAHAKSCAVQSRMPTMAASKRRECSMRVIGVQGPGWYLEGERRAAVLERGDPDRGLNSGRASHSQLINVFARGCGGRRGSVFHTSLLLLLLLLCRQFLQVRSRSSGTYPPSLELLVHIAAAGEFAAQDIHEQCDLTPRRIHLIPLDCRGGWIR